MTKRISSFLLACLCIFSFCACSMQGRAEQQGKSKSSSDSSGQAATIIHENGKEETYDGGEIFSKELLPLPDPEVSVFYAACTGNQISLYGRVNTEKNAFYQYDPANNSITSLEITVDAPVAGIGESRDGSLPIVATTEDGSYEMLIYEGNVLKKSFPFPRADVFDDSLIEHCAKTDNGFVVVTSSDVVALDRDGNLLREISPYHRTASCILNQDGTLTIAMSVLSTPGSLEPSTKVLVLNPDFSEMASYSSASQFTGFYGALDGEHTILARAANTVFLFNYKEDRAEPFIDAFTSGMYSGALISLEKDKFFSIEKFHPFIWCRSDAAEITTLTLATYELNYELADLVQRYNDGNSNKKIVVEDYAAYDLGDGNTGLTRLQADIIAGFTPDLYDLSSLPAELYASRGLLEDLTPCFSDDARFQLSDFVPSVLQTLQLNDGLYYITPSFSVLSMAGSKEVLDKRENWTPAAFFDVISAKDPAQVFGPGMTRDKFVAYVVMFNKQSYMDKDTLKCHFSDSDFEQFLSIAARLPSNQDEHAPDAYANLYTGNQMFMFEWFTTRSLDMISYIDAVFPSGAAFVGFPSDHSNGIAIVPSALVGMSSASRNKDVAADFLMFILDSANSSSVDLPIVQSALEKKLASKAEQYRGAVEANHHFLSTSYDGAEIRIDGTLPVEHVLEQTYDLIERADVLAVFDDTLFQIIMRESEAYFNGAASLQQTVSAIQSKAEIYMSEQYG